MLTLRRAVWADLDFLVDVDLRDEGVTSRSAESLTAQEAAEHREKIAGFVRHGDKAAWVCEDTTPGGAEAPSRVGAILWRYRNHHDAPLSVFPDLDGSLFPADGIFCEIFQLWVDPGYRRQGLATRMKRQAEVEALRRGVGLIYTHTEERNAHVIALNLKLGYQEVRRGPIWDEVVRVSLIKPLR